MIQLHDLLYFSDMGHLLFFLVIVYCHIIQGNGIYQRRSIIYKKKQIYIDKSHKGSLKFSMNEKNNSKIRIVLCLAL